MSDAVERPGEATLPTDCDAVLAALGDEDCRSILAAADERPQTAAELATVCDLPLSTTYRKVNRLETVGLLAESVRVDPDRNHESEYAAATADVCVSLGESGLTVTVTDPDGAECRSVTLSE